MNPEASFQRVEEVNKYADFEIRIYKFKYEYLLLLFTQISKQIEEYSK